MTGGVRPLPLRTAESIAKPTEVAARESVKGSQSALVRQQTTRASGNEPSI